MMSLALNNWALDDETEIQRMVVWYDRSNKLDKNSLEWN